MAELLALFHTSMGKIVRKYHIGMKLIQAAVAGNSTTKCRRLLFIETVRAHGEKASALGEMASVLGERAIAPGERESAHLERASIHGAGYQDSLSAANIQDKHPQGSPRHPGPCLQQV